MRTISVGHSPDADDIFMYYAIKFGWVGIENTKFENIALDIETLNQATLKGIYDICAISFALYPFVKDDFALREYLHDHHIHIVREKMIYDHGHYYPILDCVCEDKEQEVSTSQLYFGVNMLIDETYAAYLDFEENKYKNILSKVNKPEFLEKIEYIKEIRTQRIS